MIVCIANSRLINCAVRSYLKKTTTTACITPEHSNYMYKTRTL